MLSHLVAMDVTVNERWRIGKITCCKVFACARWVRFRLPKYRAIHDSIAFCVSICSLALQVLPISHFVFCEYYRGELANMQASIHYPYGGHNLKRILLVGSEPLDHGIQVRLVVWLCMCVTSFNFTGANGPFCFLELMP